MRDKKQKGFTGVELEVDWRVCLLAS